MVEAGTIFYEGTFSFTGVNNDFGKSTLVAKDLLRKNAAQLLVRDREGEYYKLLR